MNRTCDLVVVGSGLAGLTAALDAAEHGLRVTILTRGMGTLAISSGCIDFLGHFGGRTITASPWDMLTQLPATHPYSILGNDVIHASFDFLVQHCAAMGWNLRAADGGCTGNNRLVPTILGTLKPSYLCEDSADAAPLHAAGRILVVGIEGIRDCNPTLIINQLQRHPAFADKSFAQIVVPSPLSTGRSLSCLDVARFAEKDSGANWLVRKIAPAARGCDAVLIPPVCGTHASSRTWETLCAALGPVVEMLSLPPGVGGLRLRDALLQYLYRKDIRLVENTMVKEARVQGERCVSLTAQSAGGTCRYEAPAFVVATGGILGGGIITGPGHARESLFSLPLPMPDNLLEWSGPDIFGDQRISRLGVAVNDHLNPVDAAGTPVLTNVFFAGKTLAGYDFAIEKSGHGVALASGWLAGRLASAMSLQRSLS